MLYIKLLHINKFDDKRMCKKCIRQGLDKWCTHSRRIRWAAKRVYERGTENKKSTYQDVKAKVFSEASIMD